MYFMTQKFGETWWGSEWLKALSHVDFDNRLPRGATYARKGSVLKLKIEGNAIHAKVQGSRPRPYAVMVTVPKFSQEQVDLLIDHLLSYPGIIAHLFNRELDPEILAIAQSCGLQIFPSQWDDLWMECGCPDWAVPCKHIAAVIYMLSREIDNNPFLVFRMHGVDLMDELRKRGIEEAGQMEQEVKIPLLKDIAMPAGVHPDSPSRPAFRRMDFSKLTDISEAMLRLLPDQPPFASTGNFKNLYASQLRHIQREAQKFFSMKGKTALAELFPLPPGLSADPISVDEEISLVFTQTLGWRIESHFPHDPLSLIHVLLRINPDFLPDYRPSVIALSQALLFALHLLSKAAVEPQIVRLPDQAYAIRWIPASLDAQVQSLEAILECIVPPDAVRLRTGAVFSSGKPVEKQGKWMLSFFLGVLMEYWSSDRSNNPFLAFFFKGEHLSFEKPGQKEIPGGIRAWISVYALTVSDYQPVLRVTEHRGGGFDLHIDMEDKRGPEAKIIPFRQILDSAEYAQERLRILRSFTIISNLIPEIRTYINQAAKEPISYTNQSFLPFLQQIVPAVRMLGLKVLLPKSLKQILHPKPTLSVRRNAGSDKGFLNLADLFAFDWAVSIGNEVISVEEFMKLQEKADTLIKFKQQYVYFDAETLQKVNEAIAKGAQLSPARLLQVSLAEEYESTPVLLTDEVRQLMQELTNLGHIALPEGLNAKLRPYQERGFAWMYRNFRVGFGSILADDMGLGKTLQTIALVLKLKEEGFLQQGKVLVVAPTGLIANWMAEIDRFAPSLAAIAYHGSGRSLKDFDADILLTTYGVLRTDSAKLKKLPWTLMVIDEAQNIKNPGTAQSKAVRSIPASAHIALSGTPVENRLSEFWSIMDYANKGYLDTVKDFKERFASPIQLYNDQDRAALFRKVTAPFMMRRMKTDKNIIADLPDKIELDEYAALTAEQAALYQQTLQATMRQIEGIDTTDQESLFRRQGLILQMILALKQVCNHPAQFLKNGDIRAELSGKAQMLLDRVESIVESGEKVLVFTQFREMGDMLVSFIQERMKVRPLFYHGGCSLKQRQEMVERFQTLHSEQVFILSLKAAGTGLNLTAATHVIHYDLWWNPAVEAQATDRAYRIGQQKNVMVHRFITKNSFEEKINRMIQQKKHLADMTVAVGESWIGKLSNKELRDIFG